MQIRLCFGLLAAAWALSVHAQAAVDVRLVVDVSEHIQEHAELRGRFVERIVQSLPEGARSGMWTYARRINLRADHEPVSNLWKQVASIHARNLVAEGSTADVGKALQAATWDIDVSSPNARHVILVTGGEVTGAEGGQAAINEWMAQLAQSDLTVHVVQLGGDALTEQLRQLADVSGGLRYRVGSDAEVASATLDLIDLVSLPNQVALDEHGRFQVEPGARELTALWLSGEATPELIAPDGSKYRSETPITSGRWVLGDGFQMVTIKTPQVGWWQATGTTPDRAGLYAEFEVNVDGLLGSVVPTEESAAVISLSSGGERVTDADFLSLIDVRAWVISDGNRMPLPIEQSDGEYVAFFVNLADGPQKLEVSVVGPTFERRTMVPFVVYNPLSIEVRAADQGYVAWLQFSHAAVDYGTLRATARYRKPPDPALLVPGESAPGGLWKVPLEWSDGIVESSFSISGNYLNKEGFFMKTKPVTIELPLTGPLRLRFDAEGNQSTGIEVAAEASQVPAPVETSLPTPAALPATTVQQAAVEPPVPSLPLWFVGVVAALNLLIAGLVWWYWKPDALPELPQGAAAAS